MMNKYLYIFFSLALFVLLSFSLVQLLDIRFLSDPSYLLEKGGIWSAILGIVFLSADIFLPIPSSIIMIANGAIFGFYVGVALSLVGMVLSNLIGFYMGLKLKNWVEKTLQPEELEVGRNFIQKWGLVAIILTRAVPILSESVIIVAGTSGLPLRKVILPIILGLIPSVVLYALTGAYAMTFDNTIYSFLLVLFLSGIFWLITLQLEKKLKVRS